MMSSDGTTRAGAKLNIWVIYTSDTKDPRPVDRTRSSIRLQSCPTDEERLFSSPALNLRKKLAGSDSILIIIEASIATEVFPEMRFISSPFIELISWDDTATHKKHTATEISIAFFPLSITGPVIAAVSLVIIMPTSVTARVAIMIVTASLTEIHRFI